MATDQWQCPHCKSIYFAPTECDWCDGIQAVAIGGTVSAAEAEALRQAAQSGQVSPAQIVAHANAGEYRVTAEAQSWPGTIGAGSIPGVSAFAAVSGGRFVGLVMPKHYVIDFDKLPREQGEHPLFMFVRALLRGYCVDDQHPMFEDLRPYLKELK